MVAVVLKRHEFRCPQADGTRAHNVGFAVAVKILQANVMTAVLGVDDVSTPGPGHRRGVAMIHGILEPDDLVADRSHHLRISIAAESQRTRSLVGAAVCDDGRALPRPL